MYMEQEKVKAHHQAGRVSQQENTEKMETDVSRFIDDYVSNDPDLAVAYTHHHL